MPAGIREQIPEIVVAVVPAAVSRHERLPFGVGKFEYDVITVPSPGRTEARFNPGAVDPDPRYRLPVLGDVPYIFAKAPFQAQFWPSSLRLVPIGHLEGRRSLQGGDQIVVDLVGGHSM